MSRAKKLIDAATATVVINDPNPNEQGMVIVGFRIDRSKAGLASLIGAFNEMVDLAEAAMEPR